MTFEDDRRAHEARMVYVTIDLLKWRFNLCWDILIKYPESSINRLNLDRGMILDGRQEYPTFASDDSDDSDDSDSDDPDDSDSEDSDGEGVYIASIKPHYTTRLKIYKKPNSAVCWEIWEKRGKKQYVLKEVLYK